MSRSSRFSRSSFTIAALAALVISAPLLAQTARPGNLQALPDVPPPPDIVPFDQSLEPQVTIRRNDKETVEEYRVDGKLYMLKVTPKIGPPFYLVDQLGDGQFTRAESLDGRVRVPQWILKTF